MVTVALQQFSEVYWLSTCPSQSKAKEMVMLAEKMRARLLQGQAEEEGMGTKQEMQDWMLSVGITSPVTKESAGALYHQQLSRQVHLSMYFFF